MYNEHYVWTVLGAAYDQDIASIEAQATQQHRFPEGFDGRISVALSAGRRRGISAKVPKLAALFALVIALSGVAAYTLRQQTTSSVASSAAETSAKETSASVQTPSETGVESGSSENLIVYPAEFQYLPDSYQTETDENEKQIHYHLQGSHGTLIDITQMLYSAPEAADFYTLRERAGDEADSVQMAEIYESVGYVDTATEGYDIWWASNKYILHMSVQGDIQQALQIASGIRTRDE